METIYEVDNRSEDILKTGIYQYHTWTCCVSNLRTSKQRRYSYGFSVAHKSYEHNFLYLFVTCWYIWLMVFHRQDLLSWRRSKRPPMCGTCVRHIQHKANITRPLHTWRTCSTINMCFLQHRSGKKKMAVPHDTELSRCITPVGSVLFSSKKKEMYTV